MGHAFKCKGGKELSRIGASWFASYWYYSYKDPTEKSWDNRKAIKTIDYRIRLFYRTKKFHSVWRKAILTMKDKNLERNKLGLKGADVKRFVK